ncbi:MAG: cupin domain-containing protein [Holdemanella porci]
MSNYKKINVGNEGRTELHEALSLTGAEVVVNTFLAGASVPFVHSHKNNEEIYGVIAGKGTAIIDGDTVEITAGDWLKISPAAKRQFFALQ